MPADKSKTLGSAKVEEIFSRAEPLGLSSLHFNVPGNMYKFVEYTSQSGSTNRVTWDAGSRSRQMAQDNPDLARVIEFYEWAVKTICE